ncbi:hypothetical protein HNR34_000748 [Geobacillus subterraneus]
MIVAGRLMRKLEAENNDFLKNRPSSKCGERLLLCLSHSGEYRISMKSRPSQEE